MRTASILLFIVSANIDNLVISISYGIKKIKIPLISNIVISLISLIGTAAAMLLGKSTLSFIPSYAANILGSSILILIGAVCIIKYCFGEPKGNEKACPVENLERYDKDESGVIDIIESVSVGMLLTANNFGLGIGASAYGLDIVVMSAGSFAVSIISIFLGNTIGKSRLSKIAGKYAEIISGIIILILGLQGLWH